eukprot:CAMPEP_0174954976 /NCGR_PEP_ID=MMETSP0004_2-20121128/728_1 /TAXON_ID=420556 /ORGANISM="Ochromonas sp., Strain CCMP1393" /LENGTH=171 /DNA_ID=CAMNT_0016202859 /DNA_START=685 /DNA_END=1198 /DNA_ORIENTATION=-
MKRLADDFADSGMRIFDSLEYLLLTHIYHFSNDRGRIQHYPDLCRVYPDDDAAHGSIATRKYAYLNSVVGHVAAMCFPVPFPAFKHLHLMHHKHTNEEGKDPDMWAGAGPVYLLPLRWMTLELKYYVSYLPKLHTRPQLEQLVAVTELVVMYGFMFALFQYGYGREALYGW